MNACFEFPEVVFQVRRRRDEYQCVIGLHYLVDVTAEKQLVDVEVHTHQICRIVTQSAEIVDPVVSAHIPADVMRVTHHYLGNGRSPTSTADDCYLTAIKHN